MRASVEALCAVPCVEEERFAPLDLGELVPQPLNLPVPFQPGPGNVSRRISPQTVQPREEELQFWTKP